ncbi:MAG: hypothetical protein AAF063_23695, partial [Cyanobacteria bacterium J06643_5]
YQIHLHTIFIYTTIYPTRTSSRTPTQRTVKLPSLTIGEAILSWSNSKVKTVRWGWGSAASAGWINSSINKNSVQMNLVIGNW